MARHDASPSAIEAAARHLRAGELVAFPTETVYGLGADALNPEAAARIFAAKERPSFDPLICHVASPDAVGAVAAEFPAGAARLASALWPGPLTLILPKRPEVPDLVTSGQPTVGVRVPAHPVARALLEDFGGPVAAPSANRFGAVSPTTAEHVVQGLGDRVGFVLDGGPCAVGVESTIIAALPGAPLRLLRPGGIPLEALEALAGPIEVPPPTAFPGAAPGRFARHYAPGARLVIADAVPAGLPEGTRVGRLAFDAEPEGDHQACFVLAPGGQLEEAAQRLFAGLRALDAEGLDLIVAEPVPETGLGRAIMDRLRRAEAAGREP